MNRVRRTPMLGAAGLAVLCSAAAAPAQPAEEPAHPSAQPVPGETAEATATPLAEPPPAPIARAKSPWKFDLYAWGWLTGATGDVAVRRLRADVDASIIDIFEASDSLIALAGRFEIGYGRVAGYVDAFYADIGLDDQSGPPGFAAVDVSSRETIVDFGLMVRLGEWEPSGAAAANRRNIAVDVYGGARYSSVELTIDPARIRARTLEDNWFDPVVGARLILPIGERWNLMVNGDVGGFGVSSDFAWSATGVLGYDFHMFRTPATVHFGYRAIGWDYATGSGRDRFEWDIVQHGILIGLSLQF